MKYWQVKRILGEPVSSQQQDGKPDPVRAGLRNNDNSITSNSSLKKEGWDLSENTFKWQEFESKFLTMKMHLCDVSLMFKRPRAMPFNRHSPVTFFFFFIVQKFIYHLFSSQLHKHLFFFLQLDARDCLALEQHAESWTSQYLDQKWPNRRTVLLAGDRRLLLHEHYYVMCCQITWQDKCGPDQSQVQKMQRTHKSKPTEWAYRIPAYCTKQ